MSVNRSAGSVHPTLLHTSMFGFPNHISEYGLKEYLRIVVIVCVYALLRPLAEKIFEKLGERGRLREKKRREEELARMYKEQRVKEKLGIKTDSDDAEATTSAKPASVSNILKRGSQKKPTTKMDKIMNDFDSDEDVSDLIG